MVEGAAALLPRTFLRVFPDGVTPEAAASIDLPQLQSAALEVIGCSKDALEEAKCVLRSSNSTNMDATFRGIVENVCHPQERRQGLGRKRARFSLKPVMSMEARNVHMELNTDHLADPEEYFSAIEKFEFADKELKKLTGHDSSDRLEQVAAVRKRRPGILGKRASYKPFQADFGSLENHVPTLEDCWIVSSKQHEISVDPGSKVSDDENLHNASQETTTQNAFLCATQVDGSIARKENKVGDLLDTLLSSFEILDDDGGAALLQEQLQLKNISVDKLRLPVTPAAVKGTINLKMKERKKDKVHLPPKSTARNRSPLAPISLLRKQSSVNPLNDPYSPASLAKDQCSGVSYSTDKVNDNKLKLSLSMQGGPISEVPYSRICSPIQNEHLVKLFDKEVDSIKHSGNSSDRCSRLTTDSPRDKFESSITWQPEFGNEHLGSDRLNRTGGEDVTDLSACDIHCSAPPGHVRTCDSGKESSEYELESEIEHREMETQRPEGLQEQPTSAIDATSAMGTTLVNGDSGTLGASLVENDKIESFITCQPEFGNEHLGSKILSKTGGEDFTDFSACDIHCSAPPEDARPCKSSKESLEHELECEVEHRETDTQRPEGLQEQPTSPNDATSVISAPILVNGDSGTLGVNQVENDKDVQHSSQVFNEGSSLAKKTFRRPKRRSFDARKSLADAGTKWESGLRRSTRNRIRPLEFWRGEKLLYGRIHESLATVIGIKYSSPGGGALKVKSYVSDEHADLLELVSLH